MSLSRPCFLSTATKQPYDSELAIFRPAPRSSGPGRPWRSHTGSPSGQWEQVSQSAGTRAVEYVFLPAGPCSTRSLPSKMASTASRHVLPAATGAERAMIMTATRPNQGRAAVAARGTAGVAPEAIAEAIIRTAGASAQLSRGTELQPKAPLAAPSPFVADEWEGTDADSAPSQPERLCPGNRLY